jgi:bifunctional DNase/RNase
VIEMSVSGIAIDKSAQTPVVILREKDGPRMLPIWIGPSEAGSIATELTGRKFPRPLTHDLLKTVIEGLGGEVRKVAIVELQDKTYFARIFLERDNELLTIDARPSDSIALALRTHAAIFVNEELLRDDESGQELGPEPSMEELQRQLEDMDPEEFGKLWT